MNVPGFTPEALEAVNSLLFSEGQVNPLQGQCGQKKKREKSAKTRTPAQQEADKARASARQGKPAGGNRSEAAKKAAETRKKCKGGAASPAAPAAPTAPAPASTVV